MRKQQAGFTLIELVMVIVILGILAAIAIPRYVDLTEEAAQAAAAGVAGSAASASAINYAGCTAYGHVVTPDKCVRVDNCNLIPNLVASWPADATVADGAIAANGTVVTCTVTYQTRTANFAGIGAGI